VCPVQTWVAVCTGNYLPCLSKASATFASPLRLPGHLMLKGTRIDSSNILSKYNPAGTLIVEACEGRTELGGMVASKYQRNEEEEAWIKNFSCRIGTSSDFRECEPVGEYMGTNVTLAKLEGIGTGTGVDLALLVFGVLCKSMADAVFRITRSTKS
jgi:hypothetical protein